MPVAPNFLELKRKAEAELAEIVGKKLRPVIEPLKKQIEKIPFELQPQVSEFLVDLIGKGLDFLPEVDVTDFFDPSMGALSTVKSSVKVARRATMAKQLASQSIDASAEVGQKALRGVTADIAAKKLTRELEPPGTLKPTRVPELPEFPPVQKDLQTRALGLTKPVKTNIATRQEPRVFRTRLDAPIDTRATQGFKGGKSARDIELLPARERSKFTKGQTRPQQERLLLDTKSNQRIVLKEELPQTLYHVTGRSDEIVSSGLLKGQAGFNQGGLGGGGLQGVSVTPNRESAVLIRRELGRITELANDAPTKLDRSVILDKQAKKLDIPEGGELVIDLTTTEDLFGGLEDSFPGTNRLSEKFKRFAKEDIERPFNQDLIDQSLNFAKRNQGRQPERFLETVDKIIDQFDDGFFGDEASAFQAYLSARERFNIDVDPVILGTLDSYRRLKPDNIRIIAVRPDGIPDAALITTGTDEFLSELRIHADVPVESFRVVQP